MPRRTFLDTNVLIAAHRGDAQQKGPALKLLLDADRFFIASPFLELELLPKAIFYKSTAEIEFYKDYLDHVRFWISDTATTVRIANEEAARVGLNAMDALLLAGAFLGAAEEFYTLESPDKPIHRTNLVRVIHLQPEPAL
ncbi:MAG TPA: PIN domain-containing protein [Bryobacteraceae bacterium]|nr:PIN domain-containing protein [Bryobacteraceae bacterium]